MNDSIINTIRLIRFESSLGYSKLYENPKILINIIESVLWLRQRNCYCPAFILTDILSLINNQVEMKLNENLFKQPCVKAIPGNRTYLNNYAHYVFSVIDCLKRIKNESMLIKFMEFLLHKMDFESKRARGMNSLNYLFLRELIRVCFAPVSPDATIVHSTELFYYNSRELDKIIQSMEEKSGFKKGYDLNILPLNLGSLSGSLDCMKEIFTETEPKTFFNNKYILSALTGFSRGTFFSDYDADSFLSLINTITKKAKKQADEIDFRILKEIQPFDLNCGDVDIEITSNLEKAERFFLSEWLRGDPYYLNGPDYPASVSDIRDKIITDTLNLGFDQNDIDTGFFDALNSDNLFLLNTDEFPEIDNCIRKKFFKLRYFHRMPESLFRIKLAGAGFDAYRYYENKNPKEWPFIIRIRVDATGKWRSGEDYSELKKNIMLRLETGIRIVLQLFAFKDIQIRINLEIFSGEINRIFYSGISSEFDFDRLLISVCSGYALTGMYYGVYEGQPVYLSPAEQDTAGNTVLEVRILNNADPDIFPVEKNIHSRYHLKIGDTFQFCRILHDRDEYEFIKVTSSIEEIIQLVISHLLSRYYEILLQGEAEWRTFH
ncbi:MAG: hypothetical protein JXB88_01640 [Spirochaetales bacterium]|nr:hypothetical protein [Spirochaetales bacterium]